MAGWNIPERHHGFVGRTGNGFEPRRVHLSLQIKIGIPVLCVEEILIFASLTAKILGGETGNKPCLPLKTVLVTYHIVVHRSMYVAKRQPAWHLFNLFTSFMLGMVHFLLTPHHGIIDRSTVVPSVPPAGSIFFVFIRKLRNNKVSENVIL